MTLNYTNSLIVDFVHANGFNMSWHWSGLWINVVALQYVGLISTGIGLSVGG